MKRQTHTANLKLEMKPVQIAKGYDQLADHWASDGFPRRNGIAQHERAMAFVKDGRRALDVGCGSSGRIIDLLTSQGYETEGLDISVKMLELASRRHPNIKFYQADICEWPFPNKYDFISAWDSIWHVPLTQNAQVLTKICNALNSGGVFIFTTGGVDTPSEKSDAAMGPDMYYSVLGIPEVLKVITQAGCICRHLEYDQYPELHMYLIVQKL